MFQSPSLRGSGRFLMVFDILLRVAEGFNPLHCGAVVASSFLKGRGIAFLLVSIPFIAGQWSLLKAVGELVGLCDLFQSPSLRGSGRFMRIIGDLIGLGDACFNPLHCGAVVASIFRDIGSTQLASGFNPLHCGAVVASLRVTRGIIPIPKGFQSPSLRGSGRFA